MRNLIIVMLSFIAGSCASQGDESYLVAGTYAEAKAPGIFVYRFDPDKGELKYLSQTSGIANPSFLALSPDKKYVYSVSETDDEAASVQSFRFENGRLTHLNTQATGGASPCHVSVEPRGRFIVTANYTGGSVSVFPLAGDGSIKKASQRFDFDDSTKSHLHCTAFSPEGKYLFATDLGKDKIYRFRVENEGDNYLNFDSTVELEKGSGPRHLVFHPSGKYAYVINELAGTVTALIYTDGSLVPLQYAAADTTAGKGGKGSADIHISSDGKFLYASNRLKSDGIAIFSIDQQSGLLSRIAYTATGQHPRNFAIAPGGDFLLVASRDRNDIETFKRNPNNGLLENTGKINKIPKPVAIIMK
ncbi:MAG: lactonase family protein [Prevotellaceae bacterium]|jgi:6-phosphogluconolactonase (cycloisomerase 2 family)|nr:lactonase family protein [Prevotellaceae bacterium]